MRLKLPSTFIEASKYKCCLCAKPIRSAKLDVGLSTSRPAIVEVIVVNAGSASRGVPLYLGQGVMYGSRTKGQGADGGPKCWFLTIISYLRIRRSLGGIGGVGVGEKCYEHGGSNRKDQTCSGSGILSPCFKLISFHHP